MQESRESIPPGEQTQPNLFDTIPEINDQERQTQRTTEAFLDMANNIPEQPEPEVVPTQPAPAKPSASLDNSLNRVDKARMDTGPVLGPKYLEALNQLDVINDTKAISVQMPMNMQKVEMTAITGAEEQSLKTASVAPESFLKKLNELLYNHTIFLDDSRPTFNEYLSNIYPPDKAALIWGLMSASYVVLPELERECEVCAENYVVKSAPADLIHEDTFKRIWDQELSPADYTVTQSAFDGFVTFEFGIPTERDRIIITGMLHPETLKDNIAKSGTLLTQLDMLVYFTRSITVGEPGHQTILTDLAQDIYPFIQNLSPKVADGIRSSTDLSIFDEYMPEFYIESTCDHCGAPQRVEVDVELMFFRKSISI